MIVKYFSNIIIGFFMTVFGLYLWFNTDATIHFIAVYVGILFVLLALLGIYVMRYLKIEHPPYGQFMLTLVMGIIFLFLPVLSYMFLTGIFIFVFFLFAALNGVHVIRCKNKKVVKYFLQILFASIFIIYAIVMVMNPMLGGQTLTKIIAFFIIVNGIAYFFPTNYRMNNKK